MIMIDDDRSINSTVTTNYNHASKIKWNRTESPNEGRWIDQRLEPISFRRHTQFREYTLFQNTL